MKAPKVSVLMPLYKTNETYLREAIDSVLNQTYTDFELILLDDCPTDTREHVVCTYNDERIRYLKNERNLGITPSRNKLLDLARGEYIAVMDHDDVSHPERFAKQVAYLDEHPDVGVVGSWMEFFSKNKKGTARYPSDNETIKALLMGLCVIAHSASMLRKSVLDANNIRYEECFSPSEDQALWVRLIGVTKFHNIPEVLFFYRHHEGNTSHSQSKIMLERTVELEEMAKTLYPRYARKFARMKVNRWHLRLFGAIPLFLVEKEGPKTKIYLFSRILILTIKKKENPDFTRYF